MKRNLAKLTLVAFLAVVILGSFAMGTLAATTDISMWTATGVSGGTITAVDGGVEVSGGMAYYNVEKIGDATIKFKATLGSDTGWPGFAVRNSNIEKDIWSADCYLFDIKPDIFELQQFRADGGGSGTNEKIENKTVKQNEEHDYEITTKNEGAGVRWIVKIDGVEIYNILDDIQPTTEAGYFTIVAYDEANPITLKDFTVQKISAEPTATPANDIRITEEATTTTNDNNTTTGETEVTNGNAVTEEPNANPKTGDAGLSLILLGGISAIGMFVTRKRIIK